ncbi:MAG: hypothetical protein ISF22_06905 [Methanomassiliicoccus sp.]|nr:hypothetical protein [Methanomassiliicoccus sp.]
MADVGTMLFDFFLPLGPWGGLIFIFLLFYIDAIIFPTLPELFVVLVFISQDTGSTMFLVGYAVAMLITIAVAEVVGVLTLYMIVKKGLLGKFRERVSRGVNKYCDFLLVPDERMILLNRVAPILPFLGAFIALSRWDLRKSMIYVLVGGLAKYGIIIALSGFFLAYFSQGTAQVATLVMVIGIIAASFIVSLVRKRKCDYANRAA